MSTLQLEWTEDELLASDPIAEPLVAGGRRCHGGFDDTGAYRSPRTRNRAPAIAAWQRHHRDQFGTELVEAPLDTWPESYPNVAQAKFLLREGVSAPVVATLTRIGTVEGFGAMIRHAQIGDLQRFFDEPVDGTAIAHLQRGLFEAHARDEAGFADEAGHRDMWWAARDIAFDRPITRDETKAMMQRMGIVEPGAGGLVDQEAARRRMLEARRFDDLDLGLEMLVQRMISILLIEVSAFHIFRWAETVLSDGDLVAGDGEAARIVSYIRQDETPHVEYLRTALTEMRDRTFVGESGARIPGRDVIGTLWDVMLADSLGPRRDDNLRATLGEVEHALDGNPRRDDILEEFHALGSGATSAREAGIPPSSECDHGHRPARPGGVTR
ncbi:MAG TPA: hypothetical protein VFC33_11220 [Acidimicrobiia bacterium]|nr:hypothetical protein [Acidimicrobiia bacterium]